jgi:7tm Odorant receptor
MAASPSLFSVFTLFVVLFIFCDLGESVTARFERFNDRLCRYKWYLLSIEMQQMYLIFVADTQQSVTLGSYGNIECTRETFKKVNFQCK